MALTPEESELLRETLRLLMARQAEMAERFYPNLFEIAPETRRLFGPDVVGQTEKTMLALSAIVPRIHDVGAFRPMVAELAIRHVAYGVRAEDYEKVGVALIRTIGQVYGNDTPPEWLEVWRKAYDEMAAVMIAAAYPEFWPTVA